MPKGRKEAFSDGVIAIIITIMVLGISAPEGSGMADLLSLGPAVVSYAVSFVAVGTYWNNHHHLLNLVRRTTGRMLWSNLLFLFVLSFFPLATDWIQKTNFAALPTTCYIVLNMLVSLSYMNLERVIRHAVSCQRSTSGMRELQHRSLAKERWTLGLEVVALVLAIALPTTRLAFVAMVLAFSLWVIPDLRIARLFDALATYEDGEDE
ncbi:MAG: TMEM175 family protein [Olsenella sp.]|nr:TMEM175 family protein [Olsenella sp.]